MPGGENTAPLLGLAGILLVFTLAELLISPVGLSATTKLARRSTAPRWSRSTSSRSRSAPPSPACWRANTTTPNESPFFIWVGLASVVTGVVVMLASKPIHKLMAGVD